MTEFSYNLWKGVTTLLNPCPWNKAMVIIVAVFCVSIIDRVVLNVMSRQNQREQFCKQLHAMHSFLNVIFSLELDK